MAVTVVYLVDHLNSVAPERVSIHRHRIGPNVSGNSVLLHANEVEPNSGHIVENVGRRLPFQTLGNHSLTCFSSSAPILDTLNFVPILYLPLMGQLTPAHVITSPRLFTISRPFVLNGAYGHFRPDNSFCCVVLMVLWWKFRDRGVADE